MHSDLIELTTYGGNTMMCVAVDHLDLFFVSFSASFTCLSNLECRSFSLVNCSFSKCYAKLISLSDNSLLTIIPSVFISLYLFFLGDLTFSKCVQSTKQAGWSVTLSFLLSLTMLRLWYGSVNSSIAYSVDLPAHWDS